MLHAPTPGGIVRPDRSARPRTLGRRGLGLVVSLAVACPSALVATAGPAGADADPPPVGVSATTQVSAEIFARDPAVRGEPTYVWTTVDGVDGVAASDHHWVADPTPVGTSFSCPSTGCAGYDGRAMAAVDESAGTLRAGAVASMHVGNPPGDGYGIAGYVDSSGDALVQDTITLSEPATVLLTGDLTGTLAASNTHSDAQGNDPEGRVLAQVQFFGEPVSDGEGPSRPVLGGIDEAYETSIAGPVTVNRSFSIPIDLPAGTSAFRARLLAAVDFQTYGETGEVVRKSGILDFDSSLRFGIEVPRTVTATSGSGFLPLTGGAPDGEEPADTTPPTLTLADVTAEATGPSGAAVTFSPVVDDDTDPVPAVSCDPASGAVFPLGRTPVTCRATDAVGNSTTGTFDVHVVDTTAPVLTIPADYTVDVLDPKGRTTVYAATASDLVDPAPVVACTPPSGSPFPAGGTTVECTATDASGNSAGGSFVITVPDVRQAIGLLRAEVQAAPLGQQAKVYLLDALAHADRALDKNDLRGARQAMERATRYLGADRTIVAEIKGTLIGFIARVVDHVRMSVVGKILGLCQQASGIAPPVSGVLDQIVQKLLQGPVATSGLEPMKKVVRDLLGQVLHGGAVVKGLTPDAVQQLKVLLERLLVGLSEAKGAVG